MTQVRAVDSILEASMAGYAILWVTTSEQDRLERELVEHHKEFGTIKWDCLNGFRAPSSDSTNRPILFDMKLDDDPTVDPIDALGVVHKMVTIGNDGEPAPVSLIIMSLFHRFIEDPAVIQAVKNAIPLLHSQNKTLIIPTPDTTQIPVEIKNDIHCINHEYPAKNALDKIVNDLVEGNEGIAKPEEKEMEAIFEAARGLTSAEAANAIALSIVRSHHCDPKIVSDQKTQQISRSSILQVYNPDFGFEAIGGNGFLLDFMTRIMNSGTEFSRKGVLLLGLPGVGKSLIAKAAGSMFKIPTVIFDVAKCYEGLVGATERNIEHVIQTVSAMGKCVLFLDEIEKAVSGGGSSSSDGGTSMRAIGRLLTWMNDQDNAFIIGTANRILGANGESLLPPEMLRAGRWNAIFFLDLPNKVEKEQIWKIHLERRGLDPDLCRPQDDNWTGAEIEQCCEMALLFEGHHRLSEAANFVIPIVKTQREILDGLREWATGRCLSASYPGRYDAERVKNAELFEPQQSGRKLRITN